MTRNRLFRDEYRSIFQSFQYAPGKCNRPRELSKLEHGMSINGTEAAYGLLNAASQASLSYFLLVSNHQLGSIDEPSLQQENQRGHRAAVVNENGLWTLFSYSQHPELNFFGETFASFVSPPKRVISRTSEQDSIVPVVGAEYNMPQIAYIKLDEIPNWHKDLAATEREIARRACLDETFR